ncbi:MAG: TolC family outer membrane protein [Gammaproteobacteria bacterium]|nr:TolC family outer membrane protein [Gammaproteobacteria bacterium]MCW5584434.1 TolC family outer membrane protein [Gammaproteobacteria bacterium]
MKKIFLLLTVFACWQSIATAANLIEVYQQAQTSDPIFQQAIAQRLSTKEGVPISAAALLPNISFTASPYVSRIGYAGSNFDPVISNSGTYLNPRNLTQRGYTFNLSLTQTIFNFAQFSAVAQQVSLSKGADATLNAALQNLMIRVATAYFTILKDEENLSYAEASKLAYAEQLDQIKQQYKVGLKTITDVYTAQASYDSAIATYIAAQTTLSIDRENLRVITGVYYTHLSALSDDFPLVSPQPNNVEAWVKKAILQNWSIKSSQYNVASARELIKQQIAGHLPTLNVQTNFNKQLSDNINNYSSFSERHGPGTTSDRSITLNLNVPIFSGGGIVAQTNQATYNYQVAQQQLEQTIRSTINTTRQSFLSIVAGISQIKADKEAIKSSISSLKGLEASYQVGAETLVDVLNQQQNVYEAQTKYATDRYAFVNNILALKQAAGTLSLDDLRALNAWLVNKERRVLRKGRFRS